MTLFDFADTADGQTIELPPEDLLVAFTVPGTPQQRGSKRAGLIPKKGGGWLEKNGRPIVAARDDNEKSAGWMELARVCAARAWQGRPLHLDPVALSIEFRFARLKDHYGSRKGVRYVKDSAPYYKAGTPDLDKLVRALGDSLTSVVLGDDKQIVALRDVRKVYTGGSACAVVQLFRI